MLAVQTFHFIIIGLIKKLEKTIMDVKTDWRKDGLVKGREILLSKYDVGKINKFCRTVYPFTGEQMEVLGTKINIGCYRMYLDGFTNIDIKTDVGADQVFNAKDILKYYRPNSVNLILFSHCLEHLTFEEGKQVLKDFYQVLNFGGHLIVEVPDCENLDEKLKRKEVSDHTYRVCKHGEPSEFGQEHRTEFTESLLRKVLESVGFKQIARNPLTSSDLSLCLRFDVRKT
jgi:predicted SAM-dependent methyltransferase